MPRTFSPLYIGLYLLTISLLLSGCRYYRKFTEAHYDYQQFIHYEQFNFADPDSAELALTTFSIRRDKKLLLDFVEVTVMDSSLKEVFKIETAEPIIRKKFPAGRYTIKLSHWDHHSLKVFHLPFEKGQTLQLFLGMRRGYGKEDVFSIN